MVVGQGNRQGASARDGSTLKDTAVVDFKGVERCIGKTRSQERDDVKSRPALVLSKQLTCESFRPVAVCGSTKPARGDHSEPSHIKTIRENEQRKVVALLPDTLPLHPQKLWPPPYPFAAG